MKTIIAGTRNLNMDGVLPLLLRGFNEWEITEVVSGHGGNVDLAGEKWAMMNDIPLKIFFANWDIGRAAGPIRNKQMANYADALVCIWDGKSRGSFNMIEEANKRGLKIKVFEI